jgi:hypothetical protein
MFCKNNLLRAADCRWNFRGVRARAQRKLNGIWPRVSSVRRAVFTDQR